MWFIIETVYKDNNDNDDDADNVDDDTQVDIFLSAFGKITP